jgi:hypothetical protein
MTANVVDQGAGIIDAGSRGTSHTFTGLASGTTAGTRAAAYPIAVTGGC